MHLKTARKIAKITQPQLAQRSGVDQRALSKIETGETTTPTYETVMRLAKALGVDADELFPLDLSDVEEP